MLPRSMLLFDFHPTALFGAGVATTAASVWLYARPDDMSACIQKLASSLSGRPQGRVAAKQRNSNEMMGVGEGEPRSSNEPMEAEPPTRYNPNEPNESEGKAVA